MKLYNRVAITVVAAMVATMSLAACSESEGGKGTTPTTLNIGSMTLPRSMDPTLATGAGLPFFQPVYDTLIKREPDGSYKPMLAKEWKWDDANTALTITLRDDVTFDDGTKFDATAAKANLERFKAGTGANARWFVGVTEFEVVDATHVVIHMEKPDPAVEYYLSDAAGFMANPAAFADTEALNTTPDGTGPYELDSAKTAIGTKWVYTRAANYWGEKLPFDTITISVFDNETAIVNGLKTKQIDTAIIQDANQQANLKGAAGLTTTDFDIDFQGILLFDRAGAVTPELANVKVRQALNYAIDRETMVTQIRDGKGALTNQVFGTESKGYDKKLDSTYSYDPKKARELLAEAGYADGFELKMPLMRTIVTEAMSSSLESDLAEVGITLTWVAVDQGDALRRIFQDREFSAIVMSLMQTPSDSLTVKEVVVPGTFNPFGYSDDTVADLSPKVQTTMPEDVTADAQALNKHLVDDAWFVPFYRLTYSLVTTDSISATPEVGMAVPSIYNYKVVG